MSVFALLERLAPYVKEEMDLVLNSKQEAETFVRKLEKIQEGLEVAEREGVVNVSVKRWLKEIEDVAFEMEDVLDEWEMENLRVDLEGSQEHHSTPWEKVRFFFVSVCRCFPHVVDRRDIAIRMKGLSDRLDGILEEKNRYNFVQPASNLSHEFQQPETTCHISETKIYGRDSDLEILVEKLLWEGGEESRTEVVSIVGMGGAGKTTLAQKLYNHDKVKRNFTLRAWVSVPRTFDTLEVARRIVDVFGASRDFQTLQTLVDEIKNVVEQEKFLLVLDNVWTEDHTKWTSLKNCLHGALGSKILVTTRSESVARMMGTTQQQQHALGLLSDEDCAGILMNEAALSMEKPEKMRVIAVEIAKKCNGLPLAARNVGRMLASKSTEQEWRWILENPLWKHEDEVGDLYRLLKLSYFDLSPVLKRCFLSYIAFPRGSEILVDEIIRIWMACGYLNSRDRMDELMTKGLGYFQKLATRLFFQKLESDGNDDKKISFKVHDVMYDFACYLSNSSEFNFIDGRFEKIRMLYARRISEEELQLDHFEHVRALIMNHCKLCKLPEEVGKLIHLRYLDLDYCDVIELPEFICDLYNLETLNLNHCRKLLKLPKGMDKLKKLRHIINEGTDSLTEFPQGLEKLIGLWTLSQFHIGKASDFGILSNLNQLQGELYIKINLEGNNAHNLEEVTEKATLKDKTRLQHLELLLKWDEQMDDVVDALQPPPTLQCLTINSSRSKELSRWIDTTSFNSLKVVTFNGCHSCCNLPPFNKLPTLEELSIWNCAFESLKMEEFLGIEDGVENAITGFPKLKILEFRMFLKWEEWEDIKGGEQYSTFIMPCLQLLRIRVCFKLKALPHRLLGHVAASLQGLLITGCSRSLASRYSREEGGSDWDKISHIPHIHIYRSSVVLG